MRFEKYKITHYLVLLIFLINLIISSIVYLFNKNKNKNIILMGHKLIGNIQEIKKIESYKGKNFYYLAFNYKDYKKLQGEEKNILSIYYPSHILQVIKSEIIISSHGILFHNIFKNFFGIKTFFTGHAIKSNNNKEILREQGLFTEVWLYSNFEKKIYIEECNYKIANLVTTGYPRLDGLNEMIKIKNEIKSSININSDIILYAPTDDRKNKNYIQNNLSPHNLDLYKFFENVATKLNLKFLIKLHINTQLSVDIKEYITSSKNLIFYDELNNYPDIAPLAISDMLITDWSSVFVDYLISKKSILFLDTPMAYDISGVSKVFNNDSIERIQSFREVEEKIIEEVNNGFKLQEKLKHLSEEIFEGIFMDNNLERCLERLNI